MIVFPGLCFAFWSLIVVVANVVIHVPEKRAVNIRRITIVSPMLTIKRAPADHDTQTYCLGPTFCNIEIGHFFIMGGILWLYQTQGLFLICAPDTDLTESSHWLFINSGSQKKKKKKKKKKREVYLNLSFILVKVRCPTFFLNFPSH